MNAAHNQVATLPQQGSTVNGQRAVLNGRYTVQNLQSPATQHLRRTLDSGRGGPGGPSGTAERFSEAAKFSIFGKFICDFSFSVKAGPLCARLTEH